MTLGFFAIATAFASVLVASLATAAHSCTGGFLSVPMLSILAFNVGVPCAITAIQVLTADAAEFRRMMYHFEETPVTGSEFIALLVCSCIFAIAHIITFPICTSYYAMLAIPVLSSCLILATSVGLMLLIPRVHHYWEQRRAAAKRHADIDAAAQLVREAETRVVDTAPRAKSPRRRAH